MNVYKSTFYFAVYILYTIKIFVVGLSVLVYLYSSQNLNIKTKMLNFEVCILIGWLSLPEFASLLIRRHSLK